MVQHGKKRMKMSRTPAHRDATLANMAAALFLHEKIRTTSPKARALKPYVDRLITKAKDESLHSRRQVASYMPHKEALKKLFQELVPRLQERNSGYSRIIKAGVRRGDAAELAVVELLFDGKTDTAGKKTKKRRKKKTPAEDAAKGAAVQAPIAEEEKPVDEKPAGEVPMTDEEAREEAAKAEEEARKQEAEKEAKEAEQAPRPEGAPETEAPDKRPSKEASQEKDKGSK